MRYMTLHPRKEAKVVSGRDRARRVKLGVATFALANAPAASAVAMHARHPH